MRDRTRKAGFTMINSWKKRQREVIVKSEATRRALNTRHVAPTCGVPMPNSSKIILTEPGASAGFQLTAVEVSCKARKVMSAQQ